MKTQEPVIIQVCNGIEIARKLIVWAFCPWTLVLGLVFPADSEESDD